MMQSVLTHPYMCPVCSKTYKTEKGMRNHMDRCRMDINIKPKKKKIPSEMRYNVWKTYIGENIDALCFCCRKSRITPFTGYSTFQAGHIVSENNGGKLEIGNLLPICKKCNSSMGTEHWDDYVNENKYFIRVYGDNIPEIHIQSAILIQRFYRKSKIRKTISNDVKPRKRRLRRRRKRVKTKNYAKPTMCSLLKRKVMIF